MIARINEWVGGLIDQRQGDVGDRVVLALVAVSGLIVFGLAARELLPLWAAL